MVNVALLEKSYKSRPRKSSAVKGFFVLFFAVIFLGIYILYLIDTRGFLFAWMENIQVNFGTSVTLGDLVFDYGLFFILPFLITFIPFCIGVSVNGYRASYCVFTILEAVVGVVLFTAWLLYFVPLFRNLLPVSLTDLLFQILPFLYLGLGGLYLVHAFFLFFYPSLPCIKYKEIYAMKKQRLIDTHKENYKGPTRGQIRHDFYVFYKKKKWTEMLDLLYGHVFAKAKVEPLDAGEFDYYCDALSRLDASIRKAEMTFLSSHRQFPMMGKIYERLLAQSKSPSIGEIKASEDRAMLEFLEKKAQAERPASTTPKPQDKPTPIGEAWK